MPALCSLLNQSEPFTDLQNLQMQLETSPADLQALISNTLETSDDEIIYAFYINDLQITKTLGETIYDAKLTLEDHISIKAVPQERINVSALSRCSADLPGHEDSVLCCQFSPNSRFAASGSGDKTVRIWDCHTATCKAILRGHNAWVLALRFSPDGTRLVSADHDGTVCIWNCENFTRLNYQRGLGTGKQWVTCIQWDYTGERFFTGGRDGAVRCFDKNGKFVKIVSSHAKCVTTLTMTGRHLISSSEDCTVQVTRLEDFVTVHKIQHAHWVNSVQSNVWFLVRYGVFGLHKMFNFYKAPLNENGITTPEQLLTLDQQQQAALVKKVLLASKEMLITASDDHTLQLYEISPEFKLIAKMTGHARQINQAVWSPNGMFIASCSFDRTVRIWSGQNGKFLSRFQAHASEVYQVCFSSDSRLVLSGGKDSTCKVYSIKQQKLLRELPGHADEVYCVDWSLNGEYGISGSKDRLVKLWRQ
ncbi:Notchless [Hexamita inflata]|uniref:Notchless n=1 Tax=Hexamita inflata TaxID=28002 RepID=A0AA86P0R4_9EUKA|nr:Notchless [Hexamita inflata]